ncbi:MAG: winged helix-turn-helix transcriptional regulator [Oscillibacter sp.]|nr:winged helix-turn-helix transcriptional regulator [Oscillibacter sp.]
MGFGETFKALSNPVRREILTLLKGGKLSAGEISARFGLTGATISHHLSVLKHAELVFETRDKNYIYYQLNTSVLEDALCWIADLKGDGSRET